ncbi:hypothetical protein, partial [Flavobacterium sp.]|uniref:hypothetical protein n=1 Tax=Flavobacterium sp. TaxID=239 RepID=UPI0025E47DE2
MSLLTPKLDKIGLERKAALDPVIAKTKMMTNNCHLDLIFQRSLKLSMFLEISQNYLIYDLGTNPDNCC